MPINLSFSVKDYFVDNISFRMNPAFDYHAPHRMNVEPVYARSFLPLDENTVKVDLSLSIRETGTILPFILDATVSVTIASEKWEDTPVKRKFLSDTGATILYPYLRALVSSVTGNMNYLAYTPPFMNIVAYLNEQEKKTVKA